MTVIALLLLVSLTSSVCGLQEDPAKKSLEAEEARCDSMTEITALRQELEEKLERVQLQAEAMQRDMRERMQLQEHKIKALETDRVLRHELEENQIAFSVASHEAFGPVTVDTNIPLPVVYTNVGNAWQPHVNAFLVPKDGYYLFSGSIVAPINDDAYTTVTIAHTTTSGSKVVATLYSPSTWTGDANMAIIRVEVGDLVSLQLQPSGTIISYLGAVYTTFNGFFLFP